MTDRKFVISVHEIVEDGPMMEVDTLETHGVPPIKITIKFADGEDHMELGEEYFDDEG